MSSQDRTLDHYQELMTINATSHVLRAAREIGVFSQLLDGQKTIEQLSENLGVSEPRMQTLSEALIAMGIVEQYEQDFALSSTARLLCQYDSDFGDQTWQGLVSTLLGEQASGEPENSDTQTLPRERFNAVAATQWVHTPSAMQAAEILGFGPDEDAPNDSQTIHSPTYLLDLGCGSAVWSCAMAFREPSMHVTAIDSEAALQAAQSTASSIQLNDRFETVVGDELTADLSSSHFDLAIMAQRLHSLSPTQIHTVLSKVCDSLKPGGRIVVIDSFRGKQRPTLAESLESLRIDVQTPHGNIPDLSVAQERFEKAGFEGVQFTYIAASRLGLGMMIGFKP